MAEPDILDDVFAHILAWDYGLCPYDGLKFEHDNLGDHTWCFLLAHRSNACNILVKVDTWFLRWSTFP